MHLNLYFRVWDGVAVRGGKTPKNSKNWENQEIAVAVGDALNSKFHVFQHLTSNQFSITLISTFLNSFYNAKLIFFLMI